MLLVLLTLMTLSVAACGRRGDLEPPPNASAMQNPSAAHNLQRPPNPKVTPPHQSFVLDPVLQ
jgi:predicted small lipoprotein YifL